MSQEYIASIVLVIGSILKIFKIDIGNDTIEAIVAGGLAVWIAYRRYQKGDITVAGMKKK